MKTRITKILAIIAGAVLMAALPIVAFAGDTNSAASYLEKASFELREGDTTSYGEIVCTAAARRAGIDISDAVASDPTVVETYEGGVSYDTGHYTYYTIEPLKAGTTTIDVTFNNGERATVNVVVNWPYNRGTITYKSVTCKAIKGVITIRRTYDKQKGDGFKIKTANFEVYEDNNTYINKNISVGNLVNKGNGVYTADFNVTYPSYRDYYNGKDVYLSFIDSDGDETGRSLGYSYKDGSGGFSTYIPDKVSPVKHLDYIRTNKTTGYYHSQNVDIANYIEGKGKDPTESDGYYDSNAFLKKGWVVVKGKKYKLTVKHNRYFDHNDYRLKGDYFSVSYPMQKIGTKIKFYFIDSDGFTWSQTKAINKTEPASIDFSRVYKDKKAVRATINKAKKGDKVILTINGKTYTKKVNADKATLKYTFKVKKTKAGQRIKLTLNDKKGNTKKTKSGKVYYSNKLKKGMTKKQCKQVPKWEYPEYKRNDGDMDIWYYDFGSGTYDAYLEFVDGRLTDVYYY